jgi:hypothetical protein
MRSRSYHRTLKLCPCWSRYSRGALRLCGTVNLLSASCVSLFHTTSRRDATSGAADASRKRVAEVDAAFWEAVSRLVASDEGPAPPPAHVSEALEALAFDVLLSLASDTAAIDRVCRVLGQLSRRRVPALTNRLATELEGRIKLDASSAREQVACLCRGLTRLRLSVRASPCFALSSQRCLFVNPTEA